MKTKLVTSIILVTGLFLMNYWLHQLLTSADVTEQAITQIEQNTPAVSTQQLKFLITPAISFAGLIGVCTIFGIPSRNSNMWQSWFLQGRTNPTA